MVSSFNNQQLLFFPVTVSKTQLKERILLKRNEILINAQKPRGQFREKNQLNRENPHLNTPLFVPRETYLSLSSIFFSLDIFIQLFTENKKYRSYKKYFYLHLSQGTCCLRLSLSYQQSQQRRHLPHFIFWLHLASF
jgi:hypothetical protein